MVMGERIRVLDEETIGRIAAGEVIERPASIVKELLENSLDAGARKITVEVEGGGIAGLRVSDDGAGITGDDVRTALRRHATSKIEDSDDLWRLRTYGFRGEALSAIAAVSKLDLFTQTREEEVGHRLVVEGTEEAGFSEEARRPGTTISVTGLFFNAPARKKFLKTPATEFRHVVRSLISYALARIDVEFTLIRDGKRHLSLARAGSLAERLDAIYSRDYRKKLFDLIERDGDVTLGGFVIDPNAARRRGAEQWLFVNGRPFQNRSVIAAVHEGYRSTLAQGVSPDFLLFLTMPPSEVDVNVHPTKREVKFRNQGRMFDFIAASIRKRLGQRESVASHLADLHRISTRKYILREQGPDETFRVGEHSAGQMALFHSAQTKQEHETDDWQPEVRASTLNQFHGTFIVTTTGSGILIVDQHAAHERIVFEELMSSFVKEGVSVQRLLFPITISLTHQEMSVVEEYGSLLGKFGFELEPFGDRMYLLQAVPAIEPGFDVEESFHDILRDLAEQGGHEKNQYERIAKVIACRTAIKAGVPLHEEQMSELVDRLFACELPYSDIHGRATIVEVGLDELNRRFGRH